MMTRSGSPATVIKKSAKAGPKATKVHPKNTAAPMAGLLGARWRPGQERRRDEARQPGSPRGVATRPREGRGAMSPRTPGKAGTPKPQIQVGTTSSTEAEEGTNPCRVPMATSHLIPTPWRPMENSRGRSCGGGGVASRRAGSCSPALLLDLGPGSGSKLLNQWAGPEPSFLVRFDFGRCSLSVFYGAGW